jgi:transcription elongation factor GreA
MTKLTREEYEKLKKELENYQNIQRPKVAKLLKEAIAQGDLSENSAYDEARNRQSHLEGKIKELIITLRDAEVVENSGASKDKVDIGSIVKVKDTSGAEREFTITGHAGADPASGKISYNSPIGKALMGRNMSDKIKIELPGGEKEYTILDIN